MTNNLRDVVKMAVEKTEHPVRFWWTHALWRGELAPRASRARRFVEASAPAWTLVAAAAAVASAVFAYVALRP
jgi:hypothetical protein